MNALDQLIELLARMPGLGKKSAGRMSYWLLQADDDFNQALGQAISQIKDKIHPCVECGNYSDSERCEICANPTRDQVQLCVVEQPQDVQTIEATGEFRGIYHVLHGVLAPLDGIGPEELGLQNLLRRSKEHQVKEIIIATNPTLEGDSTAMYIQRLFKDQDVKISRLATGLPVGGDMEYADTLSIARSFRARLALED
ncbi:MAG: recombination mediator RecR [Spirochaetaceae bacterium]|jgi:recombination protein RecR|nr:recombination mediator RecR [Spirochaetaceae bacterium]